MVPPSSDRIPRVPPYSRSSSAHFRIRDYHPLPSAFPCCSTRMPPTFGLLPVRSPLLRKSRLISFPRGTEMFHFPRFALSTSVLSNTCVLGCPIRISQAIAPLISLPGLFADLHVLLRLLTPWHPPCALIHLTIQPRIAPETICPAFLSPENIFQSFLRL